MDAKPQASRFLDGQSPAAYGARLEQSIRNIHMEAPGGRPPIREIMKGLGDNNDYAQEALNDLRQDVVLDMLEERGADFGRFLRGQLSIDNGVDADTASAAAPPRPGAPARKTPGMR